jgi:hypothetical protein
MIEKGPSGDQQGGQDPEDSEDDASLAGSQIHGAGAHPQPEEPSEQDEAQYDLLIRRHAVKIGRSTAGAGRAPAAARTE